MIGKCIWERYCLKETLKVFTLFLLSFYFLFVVMDYSTHLQEIIKNKHISYSHLFMYYLMLFSKRCELLLPLALLISTVKVFCSLNRNNELLAFQAGGISLKKLTRPFFLIATILTLFNYLNYQYFIPHSLNYINHFEKSYFKKIKPQKYKKKSVHVLPLEDGTRLIYQNYDMEKKIFFDVFHVISPDEIYHMKTLLFEEPHPTGTHIDYLKRNEKGQMEKFMTHDSQVLPALHLDFNIKNTLGKPMENQSISTLTHFLKKPSTFFKDNKALVQTQLYYKIIMPWLTFFVLIGAIPFCVKFTRNLHIFFIFSITIFGFIAFFMSMNACIILGEAHVVSPFWAIFTLPIGALLFLGRKFLKTC